MINGFTTVVQAGRVNCFYEKIDTNKSLEIEYQVRMSWLMTVKVVLLFLNYEYCLLSSPLNKLLCSVSKMVVNETIRQFNAEVVY